MASITFAIPDDVKSEMKKLGWVNWSELAREEAIKKLERDEALEKISKLTKKSKLSSKDVLKLAKELKESMWKSYKKEP